jgi:hypothetical protein
MKHSMISNIGFMACSISLLTACSSSEWLEVPGAAGEGCNDTAVEMMSGKGNPAATTYCAGISKIPTGVARCEDGRLQIQCE